MPNSFGQNFDHIPTTLLLIGFDSFGNLAVLLSFQDTEFDVSGSC